VIACTRQQAPAFIRLVCRLPSFPCPNPFLRFLWILPTSQPAIDHHEVAPRRDERRIEDNRSLELRQGIVRLPYCEPKNRWVKVAMKLISMNKPITASMAANAAMGAPKLCNG